MFRHVESRSRDTKWLGVARKRWTPAEKPNQLVDGEESTSPHSQTHGDHTDSQSIERSHSTHAIVLTYVYYTSDHFKKCPEHTLNITEQNIVFLVDSEATHSVIKTSEFTKKPKLSGNNVYSIGSSGQTIRENMTIPLKCVD